MPAIVEDQEPKSALIRRRIRHQGWLSALGQLATMVLVRLGKRLFEGRVAAIVEAEGLATEPTAGQEIIRVASVNDPAFGVALDRLKPDLLFLTGCRLLKRDVLDRIACPVLNYHAGITPAYRGMNGGYWALASGDVDNFGGTVHLVDAGIDTGGVLGQVRGKPAPGDNLMTYAYRQAAMSRSIAVAAVEAVLAGQARPFEPGGRSKLWFHPPVWSYVWTGLTRGVW